MVISDIDSNRGLTRRFPNENSGGVTLIELMLMLAIIAVITAIAAPIFLKANNHSDNSSRFADLTSAIEAYRIDAGQYPAWSSDRTKNAFALADPTTRNRLPTDQPTFLLHGHGAYTLTTPIAYRPQLADDPLSPAKGAPFCYWAPASSAGEQTSWWIFWSAGPDSVYDLTLENVTKLHDGSTTQTFEIPGWLIDITYDPTNGTMSGGDIYKVKTVDLSHGV